MPVAASPWLLTAFVKPVLLSGFLYGGIKRNDGMYGGSNALCKKITQMYPEIGECGIDIDVTYDETNRWWIVHLKKGTHSLNHYLDLRDADNCLEGKQCVSLGLEIAQLLYHIEGKQY